MRRLKLFFIVILVSLGALFWRWVDWVSFTIANPLLYGVLFGLLTLFFILWPIKIWRPSWKFRWVLLSVLLSSLVAYLSGPLSKMATHDPLHSHCGSITYTGIFYSMRSMLTPAYQDDLEARNQMCWIRKMISRVPKLETQIEADAYLKLIEERLQKPEIKFRAALPGVLFLLGQVVYQMNKFETGKRFISGLSIWSEQYNFEISAQNYRWYDWPYSSLVKFEYGIIEKNWEKIGIEIFENES